MLCVNVCVCLAGLGSTMCEISKEICRIAQEIIMCHYRMKRTCENRVGLFYRGIQYMLGTPTSLDILALFR